MCPTKTELTESKGQKGHTAVTVHGNEVFVDDELIEWLGEEFITSNIPADLTEKRSDHRGDYIKTVVRSNGRYEINDQNQIVIFPERWLKFHFSWLKMYENGNVSYVPFLTSPNLHY